ncbi:hypothetical protein NPIL_377601 [Nephila pilipes]|uniref:Uncharacterized protein n=1 Tax=Nephila pilipes TaxID=299642 RepID=A0A8X6ISZ3_NEPPI|nr:hypothetical protein NPIL_377601 [Nephila pilipes]
MNNRQLTDAGKLVSWRKRESEGPVQAISWMSALSLQVREKYPPGRDWLSIKYQARLCVTAVIADDPTEKNREGKEVGIKSGICNELAKCFENLPPPLDGTAKKCMDKTANGKICSEENGLFNSLKERQQLAICVTEEAPKIIKEFDINQLRQFQKSQECIMAVDKECTRKKK